MPKFFSRLAASVAIILGQLAWFSPPAMADVSLLLLGDYFPGGRAAEFLEQKGYDLSFDGIREIIASSEAVFLNLETPLSLKGSPNENKTYTFRSSPEVIPAMTRAKVRMVSLANNHILDYGPEALRDTRLHLETGAIAFSGAGVNIREASSPARFQISDDPVYLLAFNNTFPDDFWAEENRPGTLFGNPETIQGLVRRTSNLGPTVVSFHWGAELSPDPKDYQILYARMAIDHGAALVVGHHPHVYQPIEIYRGRPILYSLGNFSFGSFSKNAKGLMVRVFLNSNGDCNRLEIFPLLVDNFEVYFRPQVITGPEGQKIFNQITAGISPEVADVKWEEGKGIILPRPPTDRLNPP